MTYSTATCPAAPNSFANNAIKGKLLESKKLRRQAANNSKEQFANSPDLKSELMKTIIGALDAHNATSSQAKTCCGA